MRIFVALFTAATLAACSSSNKAAEPSAQATTEIAAPAPSPKPLPTTIEEAVASEFRAPENKARDAHRHPVETLKFFGLQPSMTVVEVSPGSGWYTQILAPLLAQNGRLYLAAAPSSAGEYQAKMNDALSAWFKSHPEINGKAMFSSFSLPDQTTIAPEGTADMVLTFRNVHNWMARGTEAAAFEAFFAALKPGGVLGVVEHRENPRKKQDPKAKSGYVREADVIRMAEKAGFKLAAKSEINANPKDTKDHPEGVWTLPPTYRLGDKDRAKYEAIGESDRMTLKFVKPPRK